MTKEHKLMTKEQWADHLQNLSLTQFFFFFKTLFGTGETT